MADKFHERFQIQVNLDDVKRRFISRVGNELFRRGKWSNVSVRNLVLPRVVATALGEQYSRNKSYEEYTKYDFYRTLHAIESIFEFLKVGSPFGFAYDVAVRELLAMSELDLGVRWEKGKFYASGAELLDSGLVNDSLRWLRGEKEHKTVLVPLEKALGHLLRARSNPELLSDVVTDAYEALEALAKIVTGKDAKLDAIQQEFISKVGASDDYKKILKEYIAFAHKYRHGAATPEKKPSLSYPEAESFVYLTGIFIRLAISTTPPASAEPEMP